MDSAATAMAAFAAVLEPQRLVVGGSIGLRQRATSRRAAVMARRQVMQENERSVDVHAATLGDESVLAGIAALALRHARGS